MFQFQIVDITRRPENRDIIVVSFRDGQTMWFGRWSDDVTLGDQGPREKIAVATPLLREAMANLQWGGVPHLTPGEMQHRANLAFYALRSALAVLA